MNKPSGVEIQVILDDGKTFSGIEGTYIARWYPDAISEDALDNFERCTDISGVSDLCEQRKGGELLDIEALLKLYDLIGGETNISPAIASAYNKVRVEYQE